jgi:DnaJ-class molecular chaperone
MPARLVEHPCTACNGSGELKRKGYFPCTCKTVIANLLRLTRQRCPSCGGGGIMILVCGSCDGKGHIACRMWMPDSANETLEMLQDLEQALQEGSGGWIFVDAIKAAEKECLASKRNRLFPQVVLDRVAEIEKLLRVRCKHCIGRGSDSNTGNKCTLCGGSGHR